MVVQVGILSLINSGFFLFLSYAKIILNLLFSIRIIIDLIIYGFIKANDLLIFLCMFNFDDKQDKHS